PGEAEFCRGARHVCDAFLSKSQFGARHVIILADYNGGLPAACLHDLMRMNRRESSIIPRSINHDGVRWDPALDQDTSHDIRFLESFRAAAAADEYCLDCSFAVQ